MSNSILYYPTIEFRHEDYQWLWNAALVACYEAGKDYKTEVLLDKWRKVLGIVE